jgi:hypothetical protein
MSATAPDYHKRDKSAPPEFRHRVVPGMTRRMLAELFYARGFRKGAEIGVADGRYSLALCQENPNLELLCVDPWLKYKGNPRGGPQEQHDGNYLLAQQRLSPYKTTLVRKKSMDAVIDVPMESLDFVFIDGHHGYQYVLDDLTEWSKRVRSGGVVAGHDFYHFRHAGVVEAVVEYTQAHGIEEWFLCDEQECSFWWLKP